MISRVKLFIEGEMLNYHNLPIVTWGNSRCYYTAETFNHQHPYGLDPS